MKLQSRLKHAIGLNSAAISLATRCYSPKDISGNQKHYQKFVIASYQRSGSTMLSSALKNHSQSHCFGEVYNAALPMLWTAGYNNDNPWLHAIRDHCPSTFLDRFIFRGYANSIKAVGFKIFPEHAQDHRFQPVFNQLVEDDNIKFIHLTRTNKLAIYLSLLQARASDVWAIKRGARQSSQPITIDPIECAAGLAALDAQEAFFRDILAKREHLQVTYEQLVEDNDKYSGIVQHYLGLTAEPMKNDTEKQRTRTLQESIINFSQLEEFFKNTPAAQYFKL